MAKRGTRRRLDPWAVRGWRTAGHAARAAGSAALAFAVLAVPSVMLAVEEWQFAAYERDRYVVARGVAYDDFLGEVRMVAPVIGTYSTHTFLVDGLSPDPRDVRVMLNPRDPTDMLQWSERARPWPATAVALAFLAGSAASVGFAAVLVRRGVLRPDAALDAAAPPMEPDPPAEAPVPPRVAANAPTVGLGSVVAAVVGLGVVLAFPTGVTQPVYRTVEGRVAAGFEGRLEVSYYNEHTRSYPTRALTSAEARRLRSGDPYPLEYAFDPGDDQIYTNPPNLYLGLGWVGVLATRRLRWRRALRSLPERRARPLALAGWQRVHRGRTWFALAPYGSTRVRDVVLVPLDHMSPAPEAIRNILWVRGRLRGGGAVLVHTRAGVALWPVGRARGAVAAALLGPSPWAPEPPAGVSAGRTAASASSDRAT